MSRQYCAYCGRVAHRCGCAKMDSPLRRFLGFADVDYTLLLQDVPYKRGVPPQIKRRERYKLRKHYDAWFTLLSEQHGAVCLHCGATDDLVIDHVVSVARGGLSEIGNLQLLCARCNNAKGKLVYDCR